MALVALPERVFVNVTVDPEHIEKSAPASTAANDDTFTVIALEVALPQGLTPVTVTD